MLLGAEFLSVGRGARSTCCAAAARVVGVSLAQVGALYSVAGVRSEIGAIFSVSSAPDGGRRNVLSAILLGVRRALIAGAYVIDYTVLLVQRWRWGCAWAACKRWSRAVSRAVSRASARPAGERGQCRLHARSGRAGRGAGLAWVGGRLAAAALDRRWCGDRASPLLRLVARDDRTIVSYAMPARPRAPPASRRSATCLRWPETADADRRGDGRLQLLRDQPFRMDLDLSGDGSRAGTAAVGAALAWQAAGTLIGGFSGAGSGIGSDGVRRPAI